MDHARDSTASPSGHASHRLLGLRVLVAAAIALGGCVQEVDFKVPKAPDMSALVDKFDSPTADFESETARSVAQDAFSFLGISTDLGAGCEEGQECKGPEFLIKALGGLAEGQGGGGRDRGQGADSEYPPGGVETRTFELNVGGVEVNADGFAEITRVCPGLAAGGPADARNGIIELTSTFSAAGLNSVIWGKAVDCILGVDGVEQIIDAALNLKVGVESTIKGGPEGILNAPILFEIKGSRIVGEAAEAGLDLAFRVGSGFFEVLVPRGDEHLVLVKRGTEIAFKAANGLFRCSSLGEAFLTGACEAIAGDAPAVEWQ